MAYPNEGFNQNFAAVANPISRKNEREAFKISLSNFKGALHQLRWGKEKDVGEMSASEQQDGPALPNSVQYSRRVVLPTSQRLDSKRILAVNKLYNEEAQALNEAQQLTLGEMALNENNNSSSSAFTGEELMVQFQAVHDKIRHTTDLSAKFGRLTASVGAAEGHYSFLTQDQELILEKFFMICPKPNDAEVLMLSTVCRSNQVLIRFWFLAKRDQNDRLFHAVEKAYNKGWTGQMCRNQRALTALGSSHQKRTSGD